MNEKPGIDHLKVGDEVVIVTPRQWSEHLLRPARITAQKRIWWEFEEINAECATNRLRTWRLRKDSQNEGVGTFPHQERFVTAEQLRWEDLNKAAERYLREIGIEVRRSEPFRHHKLILANLIRKHFELEEL